MRSWGKRRAPPEVERSSRRRRRSAVKWNARWCRLSLLLPACTHTPTPFLLPKLSSHSPTSLSVSFIARRFFLPYLYWCCSFLLVFTVLPVIFFSHTFLSYFFRLFIYPFLPFPTRGEITCSLFRWFQFHRLVPIIFRTHFPSLFSSFFRAVRYVFILHFYRTLLTPASSDCFRFYLLHLFQSDFSLYVSATNTSIVHLSSSTNLVLKKSNDIRTDT